MLEVALVIQDFYKLEDAYFFSAVLDCDIGSEIEQQQSRVTMLFIS